MVKKIQVQPSQVKFFYSRGGGLVVSRVGQRPRGCEFHMHLFFAKNCIRFELIFTLENLASGYIAISSPEKA